MSVFYRSGEYPASDKGAPYSPFLYGCLLDEPGEGMQNYNGPKRVVDLGIIHTAEMEEAATAVGYHAFVSSWMDLGGRDTATINVTIPTNRLILDMAAVIRQYRPDLLVIRHSVDLLKTDRGFNVWMDSISLTASRIAAGNTPLENKSLSAFSVPLILADNTSLVTTNLAVTRRAQSIAVALAGADSVSGERFLQIALKSKQSLRSVFSDLDSLPLKGDTASQTIVAGDTVQTPGARLLYLNGLLGDVFENAFDQLGYEVSSTGLKDFSSRAAEVDLKSGIIPSVIKDSLTKLDAIVVSGADEMLPADSAQMERLHYLLNVYVKTGGRLINLDADSIVTGAFTGFRQYSYRGAGCGR